MHRDITSPLAIDVLTHHREWYRPSSTSHLIHRLFPASGHHLWRQERQLSLDEVRRPERELWILHPNGERLPTDAVPGKVQALLLDGSWRETSAMARELSRQARIVSLPMAGESRYWLRDQADRGRFSTAEALMFLLDALGLQEAHDALRVQFELHVYANLRGRGHKELAALFLRESPVPAAFPEFLAEVNTPRPRE